MANVDNDRHVHTAAEVAGRSCPPSKLRKRRAVAGFPGVHSLKGDLSEPADRENMKAEPSVPEWPSRQKRQKTLPAMPQDDDNTKNKSRGRPRLSDTAKEETVADRRRTQIRLAQRAYRHRKESTIAELEQRVQELQNGFMEIYDSVVQSGIVYREPDFTRMLRNIMGKFTLHESMLQTEHPQEAIANSEANGRQYLSILDDRDTSTAEAAVEKPASSLTHASTSVWGYEISHEMSFPKVASDTHLLDGNSISAQPNHQDFDILSLAARGDAVMHDAVDVSSVQIMAIPSIESPGCTNFSFLGSPDIHEPLPLPSSYAFNETTFARRLTRVAAERAYKLALNATRFPARYNEVFGMCLQFSTRTQILSRLKRALGRSNKESLYAWNQPFVHLGNAGLFYPKFDSTSADAMPKLRTGSIGPWNEGVYAVQEKGIIRSEGGAHRMTRPGFEGEFYDPDDVAGYLTNKGLNIEGNAEHVVVRLAMSVTAAETDQDESSPAPSDSGYQAVPSDIRYGRSATFTNPVRDWTPTIEAHECIRLVEISVQDLIDELMKDIKCLGRTAGLRISSIDAAVMRAVKKAL